MQNEHERTKKEEKFIPIAVTIVRIERDNEPILARVNILESGTDNKPIGVWVGIPEIESNSESIVAVVEMLESPESREV